MIALLSRSSKAQLAPTGSHYGGRPSDTGHVEPNGQGGYSASVPLEFPASRAGLPIPLQIASGTRGFGAAGVGWDIPLSYVFIDDSFARRRPARTSTNGIAARERATIALIGRNLEMLRQGDGWIARNDPSVTMTDVAGTWQVVDANGVSYTFVKDARLYSTGGPGFGDSGGLWLLSAIRGRGGAEVDLDYKIALVDASDASPTPLLTIDLQDIQYNPDSSKTCFKHEIDILYDADEDGAKPQALSILGERVLARFHKLDYVVVRSRATCADPPKQLRAYEFTYSSDQDTQQQQLSTVLEHGREDIPSDTQTLPVATYHYGTASTINKAGQAVLQYGAPQTTPLPSGASAVVASTSKVSTSQFQPPASGSPYAATQTLQDFNGDGRADLVYTTYAGKLEIAAGQGGLGFGAAAPLTDNVFARNVLDTRSSSVDRFASESTTDDQVQDYVWTQSIDVNGDGRIDVLDAAEKPNTWVAYLNTPDPGPSGIRWERRELDVTRLHQELLAHGLHVPADYLPLSGRKTGRDLGYKLHWAWNTDHYEIIPDWPNPPELDWAGNEQTYTEFKIVDVNGDGYPDVVFNTSAIGYPVPVPPRTAYSGDDYYADSHLHFGMLATNTIAVAYNTAGVLLENTGTNPFADESSLIVPSDCGVEWWSGDATAGDRRQVAECTFADVNGDGLLDRVEQQTVSLGTGFSFRTTQFHIPPPNFLATQDTQYFDKCNHGDDNFIVNQSNGLIDLTGDGIPDLVRWSEAENGYQVFVGTGAGFTDVPLPVDVPVSSGRERCDGSSSWTEFGLYDVNGDGRPDLVGISGNNLSVSQLSGGSQPGVPEAGRIIRIDNGYGASISLSYTSAKDDTRTQHHVPFPEIVVNSIQTDGTFRLGGTLAATRYAYGNIEMFYDSVTDAFRTLGYQRRVEVTTVGTAKDGSAIANATISDAYPLDQANANTFQYLSEKQRLGRYLEAGRTSDTTSLAGNIGTDPWALLSVDVTTDSHRIAGTHYGIDTSDTHYYADASSPSNEACIEMMFPYDFHLSNSENTHSPYNPCSARGFLYTRATESWRGSEGPPSAKNVQVYTSVRSVDDLGRITSMIYQNDASQPDDDVCVDTTYASSTDAVLHVLSAPASKKIWACGSKEDGHTVAEESWEYDKQYPGFVFEGLPTAHTVYRHATDTGALLAVNREYDADYDAQGNPIKVTTTRDDGAWRTTTVGYDNFGIAATNAEVVGSDASLRHTSQTTDATSGALLSSTDENGTTHGFTWDAFGRSSSVTIQRPDDPAPGLVSFRYYEGFDGINIQYGRRVSVETFADPMGPNDLPYANGHFTTTFFDELGRERFAQVELGADYNETLVVGKRTYDLQGRTVFEADAYPASQSEATAYGTSRFFDADGSLSTEIRGPGPQPYRLVPDPANEIYATGYWHTFDNHLETTGVKTADALTIGTPQESVYRQATSTAIGRVMWRSTYQNNNRIEYASFAYDLLGNQRSLVRYQDPLNAANPVTWSWQFDSLGQVTSLSEPSNAPQSRTYDSWGELTKMEWQPSSPEPVHSVEMSYDSLGRTLASYEENNHVLDPLTVNTYAYDTPGSSSRIAPSYVVGRLAKASSPTEDIVLSYDGLGNVNARSYTDLNNVEYVEQQGVHADGSQAWIELQLPDDAYSNERVDYDYDTASQLRWMWFSDDVNTQELYNATKLDAWGRVLQADFGKASYSASYANVGRRLPQAVEVIGSVDKRKIEFTGFDALGRETSRDEDVPNVSGQTVSTYDALGRLGTTLRTAGTTTPAQWNFSYDALGNIRQLYDQQASPVTLTYQSTDRDRLCSISFRGPPPPRCNITHDSFGNVVGEQTRTGYNKLAFFNSGDVHSITNQAGVTATFAYDAFGAVQDLDIVGSTELRHDRNFGDFITQRSSKSAGTSFVSRQFPGPGMTISRRGSQGPWVFQFGGPQGTRFTTDEDGKFLQDVSYTPYGTATSTGVTAGSPTFTTDQWNDGDALDAFGLVQVGKRIYNPSIGRFLSRDPLMIPRTAATTNPYAFAMNDPMNASDPSGMDPCTQFSSCSITAYGSYSDTGTAGLVALAFTLADFLSAAHSAPGMPMTQPTFPELATYNAAFDARFSQLNTMNRWLSVDDTSTLQMLGGTIGDLAAIAGGAAGFVGGTALCATYIGCTLGGPMMAASADIAGAHIYSLVTGEPPRSVVGQVLGSGGQAVEEAGVAGFGLAYGVTSVSAPIAPTNESVSVGTPALSGIRANAAKGDAWEAAVGEQLRATYSEVGSEITVVTESGVRTRIDWMYRDGNTLGCLECKSSETAPFTSNQKLAFPEIARTGAVIVGKGKPGFPGGAAIPPTTIQVRRP
ncbi:MAG: FG-GAP-like repeat-containing protein [Kofleriaceae bacterium]